MTPEALRTGLAATGERRHVPGPARHQHAWDPDGPPAGAIAPGLWAALQGAVEEVRGEWDRIVEHAASAEELTSHLAELGNAVRAAALAPRLGPQRPDRADEAGHVLQR